MGASIAMSAKAPANPVMAATAPANLRTTITTVAVKRADAEAATRATNANAVKAMNTSQGFLSILLGVHRRLRLLFISS